MVTVVSPRNGPTECCGALIYTVTHKGSFCANCDRKVYLWNGLLVTPERDEDMRLAIERTMHPLPRKDDPQDVIPDRYRPCSRPADHGFHPQTADVRCDEPLHHS